MNEQNSGPHTQFKISASEHSQNETWCSVETTPSSAAAKDVIEIIDCDDETNPDENSDAYVSDLCTNLGETEIICEKFVSSPSSNQTKKRNRIDCWEFPHIIQEMKRSKLGVEANNNSPIRKWMFGANMLKAFKRTMNFACMPYALYRQKVSASKSTEGLNRVFYHFETLRYSNDAIPSRCDLAEYLIDGDPELRLTKSVAKVKQQCPKVINQCRRLATDHYESLFMLYCNGDDPFFGSK
ncbi:hypothetical protein DH2020_005639 [Rehmannia glutinosa]|uniref:Uncharacterized protein n=1 Tax=Rehmannia glutinosa TaxID=99300 RepID=A0ABR0XGJ2_REHGL